MKSGTPGFRGARLVEAREARALTGVALADMVGVTRASITQYEKDVQTPRPDVMKRMVEVLNLPLEFFLRELRPSATGVFHYRSLAAATKTLRRQAQRRQDWVRDIVAWLEEMIELPKIDFPDFRPPSDPNAIDDEYIERAAQVTRRHWSLGDGPIVNATRFLENQGAVVSLSDFGSEELDAFSECGREGFTPYVSVSADKKLAARANLTASHELGHLVLHRNVPDNVAKRTAEHKLMEAQAFRFADAFLLPASTFAPMVRHPSLDLFRMLKAKWRVSIGAMIMRSRDLLLITDEQYRRLWIAYSKRGWKHGEPMDEELGHDGPRVLRNAFDLLLTERVVSKEQICGSLPYAPSDIEKLCGLYPGYLSEDFGATIVRLPSASVSAPRTRPAMADVVQIDRVRIKGSSKNPL
jgi:Zn-dependent peptidase ImmA (M78 family)/DNA-binding XRE family transcriptional regulator